MASRSLSAAVFFTLSLITLPVMILRRSSFLACKTATIHLAVCAMSEHAQTMQVSYARICTHLLLFLFLVFLFFLVLLAVVLLAVLVAHCIARTTASTRRTARTLPPTQPSPREAAYAELPGAGSDRALRTRLGQRVLRAGQQGPKARRNAYLRQNPSSRTTTTTTSSTN